MNFYFYLNKDDLNNQIEKMDENFQDMNKINSFLLDLNVKLKTLLDEVS